VIDCILVPSVLRWVVVMVEVFTRVSLPACR
jgi:hypothetical protein